MSKKLFSDKKISKLAKNKNILKVFNKSITYSFEFKKKFIEEYYLGKLPRVIFEEAGLDVEILGKKRIQTASDRWRKAFKEQGINQSMSRKGNCWDNAPMESFFGHMKNEINLKQLKTLDEVRKEISRYMNYYNNHRYQWNLKKMTPVQYEGVQKSLQIEKKFPVIILRQ